MLVVSLIGKGTSPVRYGSLESNKKQFVPAMYTPEPMVQGITKAKHPHSRPEEVNLNHHSVKGGKHFSGAFQLLVLAFCQDRCLLFLSDLDFQLCPLIIGFASHLKLHLHAKACKVR